MADNRIFLKCKVCGDTLFLGKRLGFGYYYRTYNPEKGSLENRLNEFYDKHEWCNDSYNLDCFTIEYEINYEEEENE